MTARGITKLVEEDAESMFDSPYLVLAAQNNIATIRFLATRIKIIEGEIRPLVNIREEFKSLLTIPGIGDILGFTIMLEVGQLGRFPKVGDYSSYCRCVKSERLSDGKKKDKNNQKNGNKYLSWAYVEASNFIRRHCTKADRFYQRKKAKAGGIVATKALSNKVARASYYVMRDQVPFDEDKLFA
jgi:transposase